MSTNEPQIWNQPMPQQLAGVLMAIDNKDDMQNFLRDVMTQKEIVEISARLEAARMLANGDSYVEVIKKTRLSSRTVARISTWLKDGCNGYAVALQKVASHIHTPPARAE